MIFYILNNFNVFRADRSTRDWVLSIQISNKLSGHLIDTTLCPFEQLLIKVKIKNKMYASVFVYNEPDSNPNIFLMNLRINMLDYDSINAEKHFSIISCFGLNKIIDSLTRIAETSAT